MFFLTLWRSFNIFAAQLLYDAPVAQLDRALDSGSKGWGFDSLQAYLCFMDPVIVFLIQ